MVNHGQAEEGEEGGAPFPSRAFDPSLFRSYGHALEQQEVNHGRIPFFSTTATLGHLILAILGMIGTTASFLLNYADRLTRAEERQLAIVSRNLEQDRAINDLVTRLDRDERDDRQRIIDDAAFAAQMRAEHRMIIEQIDNGKTNIHVPNAWRRDGENK